jgi:hypothetical protein
MGQLMTLLYLALLPMGAELAPTLGGAGGAAWLAPLLAGIPVLLLLVISFRLSFKTARRDLGPMFTSAFGRVGGGLCNGVFLLWAVLLLICNTARCAERLHVAVGIPPYFSAVILGLAVLMVRGSLAPFARTCAIFALAMFAGLIGITVLAALNLRPEYVLLLTKEEISRVPGVAADMLGCAAVAVYALFLRGEISTRPDDARRSIRWCGALFGSLSLLLLLILGNFGAPLVGAMERPFFQMVASLGLSGAFQRLEALVSSLWLLGDFALLGLLLLVIRRLTAELGGKAAGRWSLAVTAALAFLGGEALAGQQIFLREGIRQLLPRGNLLVGGLVLGLFFVARWRLEKHLAEPQSPSLKKS